MDDGQSESPFMTGKHPRAVDPIMPDDQAPEKRSRAGSLGQSAQAPILSDSQSDVSGMMEEGGVQGAENVEGDGEKHQDDSDSDRSTSTRPEWSGVWALTLPPRLISLSGFPAGMNDREIDMLIMSPNAFERLFMCCGVHEGTAIAILVDVRDGREIRARLEELKKDAEWAGVELGSRNEFSPPEGPERRQLVLRTSAALEIFPKEPDLADWTEADQEMRAWLEKFGDIMFMSRTRQSIYDPGQEIYRVSYFDMTDAASLSIVLGWKRYKHTLLSVDPFDDFNSKAHEDVLIVENLTAWCESQAEKEGEVEDKK